MKIKIDLHRHFVDTLEKLMEKYGRRFTALNGFSNEHMNYSLFIDGFIDKETVSDATIDGSANVGIFDICTLLNEKGKSHDKLLAFNKIFYELEKNYSLAIAEKWLEDEWNGAFYLHDAHTSTYIPYCFAYDLKELAERGLFFIDNFNGGAPQHLTTFTDFVGEFASYVSNRTSGACGLPSFLIYSYYFWLKDCREGYYSKSPEYHARQEFQRIIYKLNQPYLRVTQSAFTNFSIFDRPYLEDLFGGSTYPNGEPIIDHIDGILEYQKLFMEVCSEIRSVNMMTFPVITMSLLYQDGLFVDEEFAKWCCKHNMKWADSNIFISESVTSLSNCCRLLSDIKETRYFNSIGGTALSVGSIKVNTINLARIAYECQGDTDAFFEILEDKVIGACRTLDVIRHIISRNIDKGLLPQYKHNLIQMASQYNTIGITGIYEVMKHLGFVQVDDFGNHSYTFAGVQFAEELLYKITQVKDEFAAHTDYSINIEQIPGEKAAAILMQKDKLLFPNGCYDLPLYGNQWIPLGVKSTLQEKISLSAILDKACSGGSIAHINLDAPLTDFDAAWKLLNHIASEGVTYFAFNVRINSCSKNHGFYGDTCPRCGGPVKTSYQRIVGFLVPYETYSKDRKAEFNLRYWLNKGELV